MSAGSPYKELPADFFVWGRTERTESAGRKSIIEFHQLKQTQFGYIDFFYKL